MSTVSDAAGVLGAALKTVAGVRLHDLGDNVDPPALVIGMPQLTFEAYCPGQITAVTFPVFLVVALDNRAQAQLWDLVEPVAAAIEDVDGATIASADPTMYQAGTQDLPAYTFVVEMSLT
ncbi:hypothetical protein ACFORH_42995 [Amycolatopsis roodepoortensis]|uniref:DUF3168 domain-containing protein n=1 Tax=Amycolatopsis roodepoortensis TaxID=700274 RepID=A0ABR9L3E9_9PSEU|nr:MULTISPECIES: hypothetical protein [Amycolatopsis]MBE1575060.1 hypothetical protein [Amycolatopsis roodepoortensis]GHG97592.1 hypothetical protein GCM10017788_77220 [Amycolatopsis acidiphila]